MWNEVYKAPVTTNVGSSYENLIQHYLNVTGVNFEQLL